MIGLRRILVRRTASIAPQPCRLLASFYDSQSGKHVELPTGPQVHVGLEAVPTDRVSSALAHLLLKDGSGNPIKGLASISQRELVATATDLEAVCSAKQNNGVTIMVSDLAEGVAAVAVMSCGRDFRCSRICVSISSTCASTPGIPAKSRRL